VTSYVEGVKKKHNPDGKAYAPIVWDFFQVNILKTNYSHSKFKFVFLKQGCSIRLLNPQTYSKNVWKYLSMLQELFLTSVGSNMLVKHDLYR
jgi:lysine-specific demethylase/histidyl-hydroxylase NO66